MTADVFTLPKNPENLAQAIDQHLTREEYRMLPRWAGWNLAFQYLSGARRFTVWDPARNAVRGEFVDEEGNAEFTSQLLTSMIDRVAGVMGSMDVRPKAIRKGMSLSAIRSRAITQVFADSVTGTDAIRKTQSLFNYQLVCLGCCGVMGHVEDHPTIGLSSDYEVVHPRELFPFPSLGQDYGKQRGLIRRQTIPLSHLEERFGKARVRANLDKMRWWEANFGEVPHHNQGGVDDSSGGLFEGNMASSGKHFWGGGSAEPSPRGLEKDVTGYAQVEQVWLMGHRDLVVRYIVKCGRWIVYDSKDELEGEEMYCPVGVARFVENGTFHGLGLFDMLFSMHREMERLLKSLFNNVRDSDRYGVVVLPQGQINNNAVMREVGQGLRAVYVEPDPTGTGFRPFTIQPMNSGDVPGKTAAFTKDLLMQLSPWQDLLREKGRVDSAAGLGFLDEKIRDLMLTPTNSAERAWSGAHKAVLGAVAREVAVSRRSLPVHNLTIDLAGAVIDPETDMVSFEENPLPMLANVDITIQEVSPKSEQARKMELMELMKMPGIGEDLERFFLTVMEHGIDFTLFAGEERAAYESVVRNILLLYGNGEEPGEVVLTPYTVLPNIQVRVLQAFMSSPVLAVASPEVQQEFMRYRMFLMQEMGMVLPEGVPTPEDAAMAGLPPEEQQRLMAQQGAGAGM